MTVAVARPEVAGVIVSHGTDTMEETAWFLDLTLDTDKPVVLVGAQRNASEVDFDGPRNLFNAVRICLSPEASGKGVVICLNDQINAAREASKTSTSEVATFKSGDFGFLGQVDPDAVRFYRSPARRQHVPLLDDPLPRVDIVPSYAGADGVLLRAAAEAGARGVVLAALGCGNVPLGQYETLRELVTRGVAIVIATRVPNGRVFPLYGYPGGGRSLAEAGAAYADVAPGSWYAGYVGWACDGGIVEGDGAGRFLPDEAVTAEQMALMLARYDGGYAASTAFTGALTRAQLAQMLLDVL